MEPIHYEFSNQPATGNLSSNQSAPQGSEQQNVSSQQATHFKTNKEIEEAGKKYKQQKMLKNATKIMVFVSFVAALIAIIMAIVASDNKTGTTILGPNKPMPTQQTSSYSPPTPPGSSGERTHYFNETVPYQSACPVITYTFPNNNQKTDYVVYRDVPLTMKQSTTCAWVETTDFNGQLTAILSYAVYGVYNSYMIGIKNPTTLTVFIADVHNYITVPKLNHLRKFHFCHWFSSTTNQYGIYINGVKIITKSYSGAIVEGGGKLILGQEQDRSLGSSGFDASQSLQGSITNFMMWPRVLSEAEVHYMVFSCECPPDYSIVMSLDRTQVEGAVTYKLPNECPVLIDQDQL